MLNWKKQRHTRNIVQPLSNRLAHACAVNVGRADRVCTGSDARVPNDVPLIPSSDRIPHYMGPPSPRALSSSTLPQSANSVDPHRDDAFS